jgi:hypothetical protein
MYSLSSWEEKARVRWGKVPSRLIPFLRGDRTNASHTKEKNMDVNGKAAIITGG